MRYASLFLVLGALSATPAAAVECADPARMMAMSQAGYLKAPAPETLAHTAYRKADGSAGDLKEFRGKPLLITFWATWCPNCRRESPALDKTASDLTPKGMQFLQLSIDDSPAAPRAWQARQDFKSLTAAHDPGKDLFNSLCLAATPTHVVLDAEGRMTELFIGAQPWEHESAVRYLEGLAAGEAS